MMLSPQASQVSPQASQYNIVRSPRNVNNTSVSVWILLLAAVTTVQMIMFTFNRLESVPANDVISSIKVEKVRYIDNTNETSSSSSLPSSLRSNGNKKPKEQPFNYSNPHYDSWCPYAKCFNSPMCSPCNRRFLFIISTGRSGSTTLLKMFDHLPNVRLSGENWNELYVASQLNTNLDEPHFVDDLVVGKGRYSKPKEDGAFQHNALPIGAMSCVTQHLVETLDPPEFPEDTYEREDDSKTILGMKLIRLQRASWSPFKAAEFLQKSFPCARFVINIRSDTEALTNSYHTNFNWNVTEPDLVNRTQFLRDLDEHLGYSSTLIDFTYWQHKIDNLNAVIDWLGFENCAFNAMVHENSEGYNADKNTTLSLGENCIYPYL